MPHGHFHWNELNTRDMAGAKKFYEKAMGWSYDIMPSPEGDYTLIKNGDEVIGGMMDINGPMFEGVPENWFTYIDVDDIDKRVGLAKENGATIIREPWDVPEVGRIAIIQEPGGAVVGWMTPPAS